MNFMNRKLFKGRAARDKLNKMGGIMASSQPLMNTVQNFQIGGNVQTQMNRRNVGVGIPSIAAPANIGARPAAPPFARVAAAPKLPYATQIMDFLGDTFGPETAEERQQRVSNARAIRTAITPPEDAQIRQGSRLGNLLFPEPEVEPEFETPSRTPSSVGRRMDPNDPRIQAMISNTTGPGVSGETIEDFPLGGRRITDPAEIESLLESPEGRAQDGGEMGEGVLSGFTMITGEEQPTTKSGAEKPAPAPVTVTKSGLQASGEAIKKTTDQLAEFLASGKASETEKNDAILEQFGYKSPEEDIKGLKKRAELNAQLYRDIAGVDPEEDKKIDGYNLAMMGFMIAAGDSPDALQNIAAGMAKGTSMMMDTKKARQERDRQFKVAGLDKAIQDDEKRKQLAIDAYNKTQDRRFSVLTDQLKNQQQQQLVMIQLSAKEDMLKTELQAKRDLVNDQNLSAEARARYAADLGVLEKQIAGLGSIGALAVGELGIADALEGNNFGNKVDEILNDPTKLAQAQSIAGMSKTAKTGPQAMTPERFAQELMTDQKWVESTTYAILEDLKAQGIEKPTQSQINTELRNRAGQQASTPITGGAAAPASDRPNTVFDTQPSDAELQQLYQQGVRQITIGNQTYPLQSQ